MNDVADAAGVSKPVLYQHFRSKRALYLDLLEDVGGRLRDAIGKATTEAASPHEQVRAGFREYFRFVSAEQPAFQLLFGGGARREEEFADAVRRVEMLPRRRQLRLIDFAEHAEDRRQLLVAVRAGGLQGGGNLLERVVDVLRVALDLGRRRLRELVELRDRLIELGRIADRIGQV